MYAKISQRVVHYCSVNYKISVNDSNIKNILNMDNLSYFPVKNTQQIKQICLYLNSFFKIYIIKKTIEIYVYYMYLCSDKVLSAFLNLKETSEILITHLGGHQSAHLFDIYSQYDNAELLGYKVLLEKLRKDSHLKSCLIFKLKSLVSDFYIDMFSLGRVLLCLLI